MNLAHGINGNAPMDLAVHLTPPPELMLRAPLELVLEDLDSRRNAELIPPILESARDFALAGGAAGIQILGERILQEGARPAYRFKSLREDLGLPRVGERLRNRADGTVWKVIEERETWTSPSRPGTQPIPTIEVRLWKVKDGLSPGTGQTKARSFRPGDLPFEREWEILFDR